MNKVDKTPNTRNGFLVTGENALEKDPALVWTRFGSLMSQLKEMRKKKRRKHTEETKEDKRDQRKVAKNAQY